MKTLLILFIILLSSISVYSSDLFISVSKSNVTVVDRNVNTLRDSNFETTVDVKKNKIKILRTEVTESKEKKLCKKDLKYDFHNLKTGKYTVEVYSENHKGTLKKYSSKTFEIKDKNDKVFDYTFTLGACKLSRKDEFKDHFFNTKKLNVKVSQLSSFANVNFNLEKASNVRIKIMNMLGKEVQVIQKKNLKKGFHTFDIDLSNLHNGLYLGKVITSFGKVHSFKMYISR